MTRFLLDINVLIALMDPTHVQHEKAHQWFAKTGRKAWATCPLTQNGVMRIVGHARYPSSPGTPAAVAELLAAFLAHPGHQFWPDNVTLLDRRIVLTSHLLDSAQVTDSYLLALAASQGGKLATFDHRLVTDAVVNGSQTLHRIH